MSRRAAIALLTSTLIAQGAPLEEAEQHLLAGRRTEAAAAVRAALPDPGSAPAAEVLAAVRVLLLANDLAPARDLINRLPKERADEAEIAIAVGLYRLRLGELRPAMDHFKSARVKDPKHPLAPAGVAAVLQLTANRDKVGPAVKPLEAAADRYPEIELLLLDAAHPDSDRSGAARAARTFLDRAPAFAARFKLMIESYAEWLERAPAPGPPLAPGKPLVIPFRELAGTPAATIDVGGKREATVVLDTGASVTLLDKSVVPTDAVTFGASINATAAGGRTKPVQRAVLPRIQIEGRLVESVPIAIGSFEALRRVAASNPEAADAARVDGLLSLHRVFPGASLAFDFRAGTLTARARGDLPEEMTKGRASLPFFLINQLPHALVSIDDGPPALFLLDTGANTSSLDESYFTDRGLPVPKVNRSEGRQAGLGGETVQLGTVSVRLTWPPLSFSSDGLPLSREERDDPAPFEPGTYGVIGNDLLSELNPLFDFDRQVLLIRLPGQ